MAVDIVRRGISTPIAIRHRPWLGDSFVCGRGDCAAINRPLSWASPAWFDRPRPAEATLALLEGADALLYSNLASRTALVFSAIPAEGRGDGGG